MTNKEFTERIADLVNEYSKTDKGYSYNAMLDCANMMEAAIVYIRNITKEQ